MRSENRHFPKRESENVCMGIQSTTTRWKASILLVTQFRVSKHLQESERKLKRKWARKQG